MAEFRSNDPFRPLLSLADQKTLLISEKLLEKQTAMAKSPVLADAEARAARAELRNTRPRESSNLIDIAQSSAMQGFSLASDFAKGFFGDEISRSTEQIRQEADEYMGVTSEARERFVDQPVQEVMDSTAKASLALDEGDYLEALKQGATAALQGIKAAPGVIADSFSAAPEIVVGATATALAGGAGVPLLAKKAKSAANIFKRFEKGVKASKAKLTRGELLKEGLATLPRTAAQMSVVTATFTQRIIADWEQENGEKASLSRKAAFYVGGLATMTGQGVILKNLFIPNFKKEFIKESKAAIANVKERSHLVEVGKRVGEGLKKAFIAGGAEGGQEYVQSWVEIVGGGIGKDDAFIEGLKRELSDADNQVEAAAGAFLGFGAGGLARAAISAPAVAAGSALDITKAAAKGTAKTAIGTTKLAGKGLAAVANQATFKVLSQEERDTIVSEDASKRVVTEEAIRKLDAAVFKVKAAKSVDDLRRDEGVSKDLDKYLENNELSEEDLDNSKAFAKAKHALARAYNAESGLIKVAQETSVQRAVAARSAKNIEAKSVKAAKDLINSVSPTAEKALAAVKDLGPKAIQAVEEIRSSTALGMIEMATNATSKQAKAIVTAAPDLSMDDLKRVTNVINESNPEIGRKLQQVVRTKDKYMKRVGLKLEEIVNDDNLNDVVRDVARRSLVLSDEVAILSTALSEIVASTIEDLDALTKTEEAVAILEKSVDFKEQLKGAMTKKQMETVKRKLKVARIRLERDSRPLKEAVIKDVKDVAAAVVPAVKSGVKAAVPAVKDAVNAGVQAVKDAAETKIEVSDKFRERVQLVGEYLDNPIESKSLLEEESVDAFVKLMLANGIKTHKQFVAFLKEFPDLQNNVDFVRKLEALYPGPLTAVQQYDGIKTKGINILKSFQKAYSEMTKLNPECGVK